MDSIRLKVLLSVAVVLAGTLITILVGTGVNSSEYQTPGTAIDFGERDVVWTNVDLQTFADAGSVLEYVCEYNGFSLTFADDGTVAEINGVISDTVRSWGLWVVDAKTTVWKELSAPFNMSLSGFAISSWAYCADDELPTVGVDQSGRCIYGYQQAYRTVSLSPSITESVAAVGATKTLVGTDKYSNYPEEVVRMQASGDIKIVGDYTSPSFEEIVKVDPDVVLCDGSQYNHIQTAERLREESITAVILYSGETYETILDNIYIIGVVFGYSLAADEVIKDMEYALDTIVGTLDGSPLSKNVKSMVALSPDMSPWVAGSYTYAGDILVSVYGMNVFSSIDGWAHINSELIIEQNPSVIVILTTDYVATQKEYDNMINSLSAEWKGTDAYKNGDIYLICESAGEMAQRPGPRVVQLMEMFARVLNPDVFDDIDVPKFIGDDYRDYLTFTHDIPFTE